MRVGGDIGCKHGNPGSSPQDVDLLKSAKYNCLHLWEHITNKKESMYNI